MTYHSTDTDMVNVPEAGTVRSDMSRRGARLIGGGRASRPDRLKLRPLFVAHPVKKILGPRSRGASRLQNDFEPFADSCEPSRRSNGVTWLASRIEHICRLCGGLLKRRQTGALRL